MGESERQLMLKRVRVAYVSTGIATVGLVFTLLFAARAWAGLPEDVNANFCHLEEHDETLTVIRESLSRIETKLDEHLKVDR